MNHCQILLIDNPADIIIIKDSLIHFSMPVNLTCLTTIADALRAIDMDLPDLIMIGSGIIIKNDFEMFLSDKTIPTVILSESDGFHKFIKGSTSYTIIIQRPFNLDGIPLMLNQASDFWISCGKERQNVLAKDK